TTPRRRSPTDRWWSSPPSPSIGNRARARPGPAPPLLGVARAAGGQRAGMETGIVIALVVLAVLVLAVVAVVALRRQREGRLEEARYQAEQHREVAAVSEMEAQRRAAEAEERVARARQQELRAEQARLDAEEARVEAA